MSEKINQTTNRQYPQEYLNEIKNSAFKRMDLKKNGGNGDGKISIGEALNDLNIDFLRNDGYFQSKQSKNKFENAVSNLPSILANYAGDDKEFSPQEWAEFINGKEWREVLFSRPFHFPW